MVIIGLINWLCGNTKITFTQNTPDKTKVHRIHKVHIKIGYIVHTSQSMDCNGNPIKVFSSGRNAGSYAKKLSNKLCKPIYVYKVNLNSYSLGTGDDLGTVRYGVYTERVYYNYNTRR